MILVDTSIWIDHLREASPGLSALLNAGAVLVHPFVVGEVALGHLRRRNAMLRNLSNLPFATVATDAEVLHLIDTETLFGSGIGYVDAHLLASARLTQGSRLWTKDEKLQRVATRLNLAAQAI